jgi:hypothetical protein
MSIRQARFELEISVKFGINSLTTHHEATLVPLAIRLFIDDVWFSPSPASSRRLEIPDRDFNVFDLEQSTHGALQT